MCGKQSFNSGINCTCINPRVPNNVYQTTKSRGDSTCKGDTNKIKKYPCVSPTFCSTRSMQKWLVQEIDNLCPLNSISNHSNMLGQSTQTDAKLQKLGQSSIIIDCIPEGVWLQEVFRHFDSDGQITLMEVCKLLSGYGAKRTDETPCSNTRIRLKFNRRDKSGCVFISKRPGSATNAGSI